MKPLALRYSCFVAVASCTSTLFVADGLKSCSPFHEVVCGTAEKAWNAFSSSAWGRCCTTCASDFSWSSARSVGEDQETKATEKAGRFPYAVCARYCIDPSWCDDSHYRRRSKLGPIFSVFLSAVPSLKDCQPSRTNRKCQNSHCVDPQRMEVSWITGDIPRQQ